MPRFSIKDLLIAATLIAIGAGMFAFLLRGAGEAWFKPMGGLGVLLSILTWFGASAFIGAGLFTPFKHPWIGAAVACFLQLDYYCLFAILIYVYDW